MTKREIIKYLMKESICENHNKRILAEMDVMSALNDVVPIISHLISSGFLTYHAGKLLLKKYKQGEVKKSQIENLASRYGKLSIEDFKNSAWDDKTMTRSDDDKTVVRRNEETEDLYFNSDYFFNPDETTEEISSEELQDTIELQREPTFEPDPDTEVREYIPKPRPLSELEEFTKNKRKILEKYWSK